MLSAFSHLLLVCISFSFAQDVENVDADSAETLLRELQLGRAKMEAMQVRFTIAIMRVR